MEVVGLTNKETAVKTLLDFALTEIAKKYGSGQGDGETPKGYHNLRHTQNVINAMRQIAPMAAENGKIIGNDVPLLLIASAFHDLIHNPKGADGKPHPNEEDSAQIATEQMKKSGVFDEEEMKKVKEAILATKVSFPNGVLTQAVTDSYLTKLIADADLSTLGQGSAAYWAEARGLLTEMLGREPTKTDEVDFIQKQISFLENHHYHTPEAQRAFPYKQANIEFSKQQLQSRLT